MRVGTCRNVSQRVNALRPVAMSPLCPAGCTECILKWVMSAVKEGVGVTVIPEYGVVILRDVLTPDEQRELYLGHVKAVAKHPRGSGSGFVSFNVSYGAQGGSTRQDSYMHEFGEKLFFLAAERTVDVLREESEKSSENSDNGCAAMSRMREIADRSRPPIVEIVSGNAYLKTARLNNHTDAKKPFCTMSFALGCDCELEVGRKTGSPHALERHGTPVRVTMRSGDAMFFDGGCVPHCVDRILPGTAPAFWDRVKPDDCERIILLFREKMG